MNVLILNWRDIKHPLHGGAEISLFEHAKYWAKQGTSVCWFTSSFEGGREEEEIEGIRIVRRGSHYTVHLWALFYFLKGRFRDIDIVIDSFHFIPFFTPLYLSDKKIIALINEPAKKTWFENISLPFSLIGFLLEPLFFVLYKNSHFITGSSSIAHELEKEFGIRHEYVHVIHHGVKVKRPKKNIRKEKNPTVIYISRISSDKGIEDALHAIGIVQKKIPQLKAWIVGKAQSSFYLRKIERLVLTLGLKKIVRFFGFVSEEKKFELFSQAWVLIHPSIREGWGLNVIEANAMGTPSVGYRVSGLKDSIKDKVTGILTQKNTYQDLADAVFKIIEDKHMYQKFSKNAIAWSKKFVWKKSVGESWNLIASIERIG